MCLEKLHFTFFLAQAKCDEGQIRVDEEALCFAKESLNVHSTKLTTYKVYHSTLR